LKPIQLNIVKQLILISILVIVFAGCEKQDNEPVSFSFEGTWNYIEVERTIPTLTLTMNQDQECTYLAWYNKSGCKCVQHFTIMSSFLDGDTLRIKATYQNTPDNYTINIIVFFGNSQSPMYGRFRPNISKTEYAQIQYGDEPVKFYKQ